MRNQFSRGDLIKLAGTAAIGIPVTSLAASTATSASDQTSSQPSNTRIFPKGFYWGVGTSSYQIEGAWNKDGKGPSIWDAYCHEPGHIKNNDTGDVANDHYHRYKEDVALMKDIGANSYRFSIAWPRLFPEGTGKPNPKGIDFNNRLVDEMKTAGIEPFATLYHWDLPQTLQDKYGGWKSKDTAKAFADYAGYVAEQLGDRVKHFITINEFRSFVEGGYQGFDVQVSGGKTLHKGGAPGERLSNRELNQVRHHAVLGHGLAVQAIRARGPAGTQVGFAENMLIAVPFIETPAHIKAAETATRELNADFTTVMLEGRYTDAYLKRTGPDAPKFTDEELKTIASPLDFVGINIYKPNIYVEPSADSEGYHIVPINASHPKMDPGWIVFDPEALYWGPHHVHSMWGAKSIFITENGTGASDVVADDGRVYDSDRVMYMRHYLTQLERATADGVPVKGYFHWSLMDNFEWIDGFGARFGLIYVDFKTQKRTPKLSASFYRETIKQNAVA